MKLYTDVDLTFKLNANGDIASYSDEDCIRVAIINSVNLESFDIPFNEWYAPNIKYQLFEHHNNIVIADMKRRISDVLELDPRFSNPKVEVTYNDVNGSFYCYIDITVFVTMMNRNITEQIKFERVH